MLVDLDAVEQTEVRPFAMTYYSSVLHLLVVSIVVIFQSCILRTVSRRRTRATENVDVKFGQTTTWTPFDLSAGPDLVEQDDGAGCRDCQDQETRRAKYISLDLGRHQHP